MLTSTTVASSQLQMTRDPCRLLWKGVQEKIFPAFNLQLQAPTANSLSLEAKRRVPLVLELAQEPPPHPSGALVHGYSHRFGPSVPVYNAVGARWDTMLLPIIIKK